ncbi:MAG TPA: hypoxanthine phosphoribosyltransferase [Tepidisphaeraceae bacterium]|nr:hypoxanthine phosphoribosyltransferase [Tepidisphaeraceae bacterium]
MQGDIDRVLLTHQQIQQRIVELAGQITADHAAASTPDSSGLTIIPILTGAMIFCADLVRQLPLPLRIDLIDVSSYPGTSMHTQGSQIRAQRIDNIQGRHVLLIDDILDSGGTLRLVCETLRRYEPAGVKSCVLLRKPTPGARRFPVDYVGFDIPDEFVVGYGLDYDDYYRNLPDIVTLKRHVIERAIRR